MGNLTKNQDQKTGLAHGNRNKNGIKERICVRLYGLYGTAVVLKSNALLEIGPLNGAFFMHKAGVEGG